MKRQLRTWYQNIDLRKKLLLTNVITTGIAIFFAVISMSAFLYHSAKDNLVGQAHNLSTLIAGNIAPAIYFDDRKTMQEILHGLHETPFITSATLYDSKAKLLTDYRKDQPNAHADVADKLDVLSVSNEAFLFHDGILEHHHAILAGTPDHARLATLVLHTDLSAMYEQLFLQLAVLVLAGLTGSALTSWLLVYFQRDISAPILELTALMHHVSVEGDLSARSNTERADELGKLAQGFNRMISQISQGNLALHESREQMHALNQRLNALIDALPDAVFLKDSQGRWLVTSALAKEIFQLHDLPWQGKTDMELAEMQPGSYEMYEACVRDDELAWDARRLTLFEEKLTFPDGSEHHYDVRKVPIFNNDGRRDGLVIIGRDITQQKRNEENIHRLAFYDPLTNLPNRRLLMDRLGKALISSRRSMRHGALLFMDLDNFKTLNDTRGHDIGDLLLIEIAQRLNACVRGCDTVGRLGGDEFVIMLEDLSEDAQEAATQTQSIGNKAREAIAQPYLLNGLDFSCTTSIGVRLFSAQDQSIDELLKHADLAMYQAKKEGHNNLRFFDPDMQAAMNKHSAMEADLRRALEREQLHLYYQIQVDSAGHSIGAEALLRWQHHEHGLVSPATFIPVAEETGLIVPIGLWVLHTACAQIRDWSREPATRDLQLAINVSARQFRQQDFVEQVRQALSTTGIDPTRLKIELTESLVLDNISNVIAKMYELKALGIGFSMDDFGTGYSSLSYLKQLPLDQLKIDQSFVRDLTTDANDASIVQAIITMGSTFGLNVIAEGVETEAQHSYLERQGCHAFQGYLFGKPVPISQFEAVRLQYP